LPPKAVKGLFSFSFFVCGVYAERSRSAVKFLDFFNAFGVIGFDFKK